MPALPRLLRPLAMLGPLVLGGALLVASLSFDRCSVSVPDAEAKQSYESAYTYDQTWNTALRLVRVDLGLKIVDKDDKAGFIMFEYVNDGSTSSGSLELFKTEKSVRVICQIPKFPSYHEIALLDRLGRKLKEEYGTPPEKPKPKPPDPPDGGTDGGDDATPAPNVGP